MKTNFATMHSALSDAYMVLNKAHMDYRPIPTAELVRVLGVLEQALAIKPRNCDRFATVDEARKAHEEYRGDYIMRASNIFDFPMEFDAWLFAPRRRRKEARSEVRTKQEIPRP